MYFHNKGWEVDTSLCHSEYITSSIESTINKSMVIFQTCHIFKILEHYIFSNLLYFQNTLASIIYFHNKGWEVDTGLGHWVEDPTMRLRCHKGEEVHTYKHIHTHMYTSTYANT